jgi:predicted nucleic acid-binding protein
MSSGARQRRPPAVDRRSARGFPALVMVLVASSAVRLGAVPTVYLDLCCFNRPFDDQSQPRVHLEAEAVLAIVQRVTAGSWGLVGSGVLKAEARANPDANRRKQVLDLMEATTWELAVDLAVVERARDIQRLGFGQYDSLHLACAERAGVDVLLTTDDVLMRLAKRQVQGLQVRVENPLVWLGEVT